MRKSPKSQGSGTGADALDTSANSAADALQALATIVEQLQSKLQAIAATPGGAGAQPGAFFETAAQLTQAQGAQATIQAGGSLSPSVLSALTSSTTGGGSALVQASGGQTRDAMGRFVSTSGPDPMAAVGNSAGVVNGGSNNPFAGMAAIGPATSLANAQVLSNTYGVAQNPNNPFAGAPASGPAMAVGNPGFNLNNFIFNQQLQQAQQQTQLRAVGTGVAVAAVSSGLHAWAENTASGDYDPMRAAHAWGTGTGAVAGFIGGMVIGAAAPVPEPGLGALIGSGIGAQLGAATAEAAMAPFMRTRKSVLSLTAVSARMGLDPYELFGAAEDNLDPKTLKATRLRGPAVGGLSDMAERITYAGKSAREKTMIASGLYTGTDIISGPQIAETFATVGSALLNAGEDGTEAYGMTERLARKYKMVAPQMAQMAAPVLSAQNRFGKNSTDLLMRFGPEAYGAAADALGGADLTPAQRKAYAGVQTSEYELQKVSLQARGSGSAEVGALSKTLPQIAALPDGKDSLAYAQAAKELRDAKRLQFDQEGMTKFGLPMTHLQGQLDRAEIMPFAPANVLKLSLQTARLDGQEIGRLDAYVKKRKASGELSEQEELELAGRRESLLTDQARVETLASEGYKERLPAMMANVPGRVQGRFTTPMMAANNLAMMGVHNIRAFGAANGQEMAAQDAVFNDIGGAPGRASSRTSTSSMTGGDSGRIANLLEQILNALRQNGGRGGRASDALGQAGAAMGRQQFGNSGGGNYN